MNFLSRLLSVFTAPFQHGYKMVKGQWAWVSYDEAVGKRVSFLEAVDGEALHILEGGKYALDQSQVFLAGKKIPNANPRTFVVIDAQNNYAKDGKQVFLETAIIPNVHLPSFQVLAWPYAKDQDTIYCGMLPMQVDQPELFEVTHSTGMRRMVKKDLFMAQNPDYAWLSEWETEWIIYGHGSAKAGGQQFEDFRKIEG